MKFWGLGSLIQATPCFRALRERFPDAEIDLLTIRGNQRLFEDQPFFDNLWTLDVNGGGRFLLSSIENLLSVRRRKYDLLFNFEGFASYSSVFSNLSAASVCVGYRVGATHRCDVDAPFREETHISEVYADLLEAVGVWPESLEPQLEVPPEGERFQRRWRVDHGVPLDARVVGMNVNTGPISPARRWPRERFIELGRRLAKEANTRIVLIGGPDEVDYVAPAAEALGKAAVNLAGRTRLPELLGLLADVDVFITNDSGPLHIAAAMGAPTVSFFGPESPKIYGPRGARHSVLYKGLPCSPCLTFANLKRTDCDHFSCLREVTVEEALLAVASLRPRERLESGQSNERITGAASTADASH